ncbi:MAG: undecaprenyl-diphosphate phosphatase [Armatimonadota bacterium]|nr:undecaprenyl-diphosphate phosphatase [Armatimonadota bacterium]
MFALIILGLVQGLTEFLPVSSTAHLLFTEHYLGIPRPGLVLEAVLHLGTAAAAIVMFWPDVVRLLRAAGSLARPGRGSDGRHHGDGRLLTVVVTATLVTAVLGFAFADPLEQMFRSVRGTAYQLVVTGIILLWRRERGARDGEDAGLVDGLALGVAQALAIVPGISRSGTTIVTGLALGFRRTESARLSFLIAIPAIVGASLFSLRDASEASRLGFALSELLVGGVVAGVSGAMAIAWLLNLVRRQRLAWFALYCWVVAAMVLLTAR